MSRIVVKGNRYTFKLLSIYVTIIIFPRHIMSWKYYIVTYIDID